MSRIFPESLVPLINQLHSRAAQCGGAMVGCDVRPEWNDIRSLGSRDTTIVPTGYRVMLTYAISGDRAQFEGDANAILTATGRAAQTAITQARNNVVVSFFWIYREE